jgi:hypothetical protein
MRIEPVSLVGALLCCAFVRLRSPADVPSPPAGLLAGMSLVALVAIGLVVAAVVIVAVLVLRAVRKSLASRKGD